MSDWHDSRCAAESRRGEVASILPETEQKTAIHTLYQSVSSCLIVVSAHMVHKGCREGRLQACMRSVWIFEIIVRLTHHTLMLMYAYISINDEGKE